MDNHRLTSTAGLGSCLVILAMAGEALAGGSPVRERGSAIPGRTPVEISSTAPDASCRPS